MSLTLLMKHKHHFHTYLLYIYFIMYLSSYFKWNRELRNRALPLLCLRRGCSLVTVSPGASVLLTSVQASGRGKNISSVYYGIPAYLETRWHSPHWHGTGHHSLLGWWHNTQLSTTLFRKIWLYNISISTSSTSGIIITRKWIISVVCDWQIWKSRDSRLLLLAEPSRTGAGHDTVVAILDSDLSLTIIGGNFVWITWQKVVISLSLLPLHNTTLSCDNCSALTLI